ncbi:hypothetical protein D3C77_434210 [compost metagenome]
MKAEPVAVLTALKPVFELSASLRLSSGASLLQHLLWCAYQAQRDNCEPSLVVAALLHDIGHYFCALDPETTSFTADRDHAVLAASWLSRWFPPAVYQPIALHSEAKRYLAARNQAYLSHLDKGSKQSLAHQGGAMTLKEALSFERTPYAQEALRLRYYDDHEYESVDLPNFDTYTDVIRMVLESS